MSLFPPRPLLATIVALSALGLAHGGSAVSAQEPDDPTSVVWDDHSLVVRAAAPGTLALTDTPGAPYDGPRIHCAWFALDITSTTVDLVGIVEPVVGATYVFNCWFTDPWTDRHPGYPVVAVYDPVAATPGPAITTPEVARFAVDSIDFESPVPVTAPAETHVVGIESWFAVDSRLDYGAASAQAGPVWATVRPEFRDVTWDLGNGDRLVCEADATTRWDPEGPARQSSACTYTYPSSAEAPLAGSATVRWTVWQRTDRTGGAWVTWGTVELTTTAEYAVAQLQAVID